MDRATIKTLLDLLNPLHGSLDRQTYDEKVEANFDAPRDAEYNVDITTQQERDLTRAVCILESVLNEPVVAVEHIKIKYWWSGDRKWFCILSDDGINKATVSLTVEEASLLSMNAVQCSPQDTSHRNAFDEPSDVEPFGDLDPVSGVKEP